MRPMTSLRGTTVLLLVSALVAAGCGDAGPPAHDQHAPEAAPGAASGVESAAGHHHNAPHGGTLVELEEETFNLELLADPEEGVLTAWTLDGHCEHPVRIVQDEIDLTLDIGGTAVHVRLDGTENVLTGEKKGDTSEFRPPPSCLPCGRPTRHCAASATSPG